MKSSCCFLLLLIVFGVHGQADIDTVMKTRYGYDLLEMVSLRSQATNPVPQILQMLADLSSKLAEEQRNSDEIFNRTRAQCTIELSDLAHDIKETEELLQSSQDNFNSSTQQVLMNEKKLASLENSLVDLKNKAKALLDNRKKEEDEFNNKKSDLVKAEETLFKAKGLFLSLKTPSAFLEVPQTIFAQIKSDLKKVSSSMKKGKLKSYLSILITITEHSPISNQEILIKIINIVDKIIKNIQDSSNIEEKANNLRLQIFLNGKENLEKQTLVTESSLATTSLSLKKAQDDVKHEERSINTYSERLKFKTSHTDIISKTCLNDENQYLSEKAKRDEELSIVRTVIEIVNSKLGSISEYLRSKMTN